MPHFGQLKALTGTLQADGVVSRVANSLTTTAVTTTSYELREDGSYELREDGSRELRD